MAGQGVERREMMRILAMAAAASRCPVFEKWAFAGSQGQASPRRAYQPQFFSSEEYATVAVLAELMVPGSGDAGASEFIDFMAASDPEIQSPFRYGLTWLDAHSRGLYGKVFRELSSGEQTEILEHLAYRDRHRRGEEDGRAFFRLARRYTVMGFYTSRVGMEQLGYPGLRVYGESPECGHVEHRG